MSSRRDDQIQVILASSEKTRIATHAERIGMSASAFLRHIGLEKVREYEKSHGMEDTDETNVHCG